MGKTKTRDRAAEGRESDAIELSEMPDHIGKLRQVSTTTKSLIKLLGEQLQGLSETIPVLRGFEIVEELRRRSKEHHEGLESAFKPLHQYIELKKSNFYADNAKWIEELIRQRVADGVKKKLPVVLKERIKKYQEYLETNGVLTKDLRRSMAIASSRAANLTLNPNHPTEEVTLISPHPNWNGLTLESLKHFDGPTVTRLAIDQGLTPLEGSDSEYVRVKNINMILRYLGTQYQVIPSRNGLLLMTVPKQTSF